MGLLSKIGGAIKSLFGSGVSSGGSYSGGVSHSNTTYEPDKVKIAEIEADTKIRLANMENERIELMKQARLDTMECEVQSKIALEQAKAQGFTVMAQSIIAMQEKLNEVAEKRLMIIEKGSLQVIKEIENFYNELGTKVQEDNEKYSTEKLPQLLSILEKYDENTPAYNIYLKRIEEDMNMQVEHYTMQINAIVQRQSQIIDGFLKSKDKIVEQTGQITSGMLETIQNQTLALNSSISSNTDSEMSLIGEKEKLALPGMEQV